MATTYSADRLTYMQLSMTKGEIYKMTGIHWKTQDAILKGTKFLTTERKLNLNRQYSKVAYRSMRDDGFSVKQATRFRGYTPFSTLNKQIQFNARVTQLAEQGIQMKYINESDDYIRQKLREELLNYKTNIRWSNYMSEHDFEYFMDRGT